MLSVVVSRSESFDSSHVAVCCSVLQCVEVGAGCRSMLRYVAVCVTVCCSVLQYVSCIKVQQEQCCRNSNVIMSGVHISVSLLQYVTVYCSVLHA